MRVHVALTFDDGYLSHYRVAKILHDEGINGTFFIITHLQYFENKPLLTLRPEIIQVISDMGHEIGSHTRSHPNLTKLPCQHIEYELKVSKSFLEGLIRKKVLSFAYPGGFYNKDVLFHVARYYKYARLAGKRFEAKTWNAQLKSRYLIEGIGYKELLKLPMKYILYRYIRPVIVFHDDPLHIIKAVIKYLRFWGAEFLTLGELFEEI
ncbi:MAG: polysaccharide deacetylase family protein [Desulfurococcaceae archaeon]